MQIDDALLVKLEKLSALKITDEKREELKKQLGEILNFVENLNELDLSHSEVVVSALSGGTPFRMDEVKMSQVIDPLMQCAPKVQDGFFIVPKIIE
ncbi:Asp-tRNA(Asn)/Glu-tRNA(Gln) amidotransferase subunit GatC [Campylobacter sp. US33a]|uniref:Aspartyl/glutamyl-tRNA(Asn/Gln) amidotransferase subunit C n=1 Tax=Campylobacter sp. CCS1377 TaxID=3158229 RepID=A0AAU7E9D9_9BACT|nr:Asp-tRNA(Asn)/Glu-tRNA(Gln) amidotransferase subunit GatC [Campylobacter sp. US33a]MCW1360757.1 Asp-tRNA(Asn)/Glu-tRNA(Gln) amidotransferase subunit GatC [Campylobacter jejuni]TEY00554.1 Asp-tRNA(Asn)/Glu-tRNA(Gln) amidotransferase subunit GatC [Campylobacter sp. US33a]